MNRLKKTLEIRNKLKKNTPSIGSWIQVPNGSIAEIMGQMGYDWVAVDCEHGSIGSHQLPDLFRALELGGTLPLVRLAEGCEKDCKQALDAGAGGVIVPNIKTAKQLDSIKKFCDWPPAGKRGVGFSRANLFGKNFQEYNEEAQSPLLIAMIENIEAVKELESILKVDGIDAILIGPYDLSASLNETGNFDSEVFKSTVNEIKSICKNNLVPFGIHVVNPDIELLTTRIKEGYQFIAYSIDSVLLINSAKNPIFN